MGSRGHRATMERMVRRGDSACLVNWATGANAATMGTKEKEYVFFAGHIRIFVGGTIGIFGFGASLKVLGGTAFSNGIKLLAS